METSEVLNRAADLIQERGWTTGEATDPWGLDGSSPLCLEGGIMAAAGVTDATGIQLLGSCPAARAVHDYLSLPTSRELWRWNDAYDAEGDHARTASEVIEVLRAAAAIEQAREAAGVEVSA